MFFLLLQAQQAAQLLWDQVELHLEVRWHPMLLRDLLAALVA